MFNHGDAVSQEYKKLVALLPRLRIGLVNINIFFRVSQKIFNMIKIENSLEDDDQDQDGCPHDADV